MRLPFQSDGEVLDPGADSLRVNGGEPQLGAARASMVICVIPAVGLTLGAVLLGKQVDGRLLIGAVMIVGSIAIVSLRLGDPVRCPAPTSDP